MRDGRRRPSASAWVLFGLALGLPCGRAFAGEPLARFEAAERLGVDWRPTLLTYALKLNPGQARPGEMRLVDPAGAEHPCQLWQLKLHPDGSIASARVSFMAELKKGASFCYGLVPGKPAAATSKPQAIEERRGVVLDNGLVALRLPRAGDFKFPRPLAFGTRHADMVGLYGRQAGRGIAPGPIQGIRLADGRWAGGSYFAAEKPEEAPKLFACDCRITEQGPLFVEAAVRYQFDGGRSYVLTARVLAGDPAVRIDEQFDLRRLGPGAMWRMVVSLSGSPPAGGRADGWRPDGVFWQAPEGRLTGHEEALETRLAELGFETKPFQSRSFGSRKLAFDLPAGKVFDLAVWYPWHPAAHYFALVDSRSLSGPAAKTAPFLAVVPLHAGTWRSAHQTFQTTALYTHEGGDIALHWPLVAEPHPNTVLHTGEYDPALPLTFCRRQWALIAGPLQFHGTLHPFRAQEGYVNLDDYKDWVLDWPADPKVAYPRLVFTQDDVKRLAPVLDAHPGGEVLKKFLYFTEDDARRDQLWKGLTSQSEWSGPLGQTLAGLSRGGDARETTWVTSYRQTQMAGWAGNADELLASPRLTDGQRRTLRAYLAAACELLSEPDFNPRGSMIHLGNPNMPINRFLGLAFAAALIPDHPRAGEWLDVARAYLRFKLAMNTAPGGTWSELITYFGASAPHVMQAATVLGLTGRLDDSTARLTLLPAKFTVHLLSPKDPRFAARTVPNWGHEGCDLTTHWLVAAGLARKLDPALAKALVWAWDQTGRPMEQHHDAGFSERVILHADLLAELKPGYVPDELGSTWLPGFGATLRAHPGGPNETFLAYRQGYCVSHCDANQGDFILHARGAPLTTLSLFGYAVHDDRPFARLCKEFGWHNRVRFGSMGNDGGWPGGGPISQVHAHFFSPSADYLRGLGDYGPQRWTRQILFMKSKAANGPSYFVFRDSFYSLDGDATRLEPTWWYLRTPGSKDLVKASETGLSYTSPFGPKLAVHFLQPAAIRAETRDATQSGPLYNRSALNWQKAGSPVLKGSATSISVEETLSVTAVGPNPPGQDLLVVLYPHSPSEPLPKCERLADGVAKITTSEATDYVFLDRKPMSFKAGDAAFGGLAGAIRVYADQVRLVVAEGPGYVGYKEASLGSSGPTSSVVPAAELDAEKVMEAVEPEHRIAFTLGRGPAKAQDIEPGIKRHDFDGGFAYAFDSNEPMAFGEDGVAFVGLRGGIEVDERQGAVRLVMLQGERLRYRDLAAWGCDGPYDVTFHRDRITGRTAGRGRFLYLSMPEGLDRLPMLILDGQTFAPGTLGRTLIVPVMPGEHEFTIRALDQPPVWRHWPAWPDGARR